MLRGASVAARAEEGGRARGGKGEPALQLGCAGLGQSAITIAPSRLLHLGSIHSATPLRVSGARGAALVDRVIRAPPTLANALVVSFAAGAGGVPAVRWRGGTDARAVRGQSEGPRGKVLSRGQGHSGGERPLVLHFAAGAGGVPALLYCGVGWGWGGGDREFHPSRCRRLARQAGGTRRTRWNTAGVHLVTEPDARTCPRLHVVVLHISSLPLPSAPNACPPRHTQPALPTMRRRPSTAAPRSSLRCERRRPRSRRPRWPSGP